MAAILSTTVSSLDLVASSDVAATTQRTANSERLFMAAKHQADLPFKVRDYVQVSNVVFTILLED